MLVRSLSVVLLVFFVVSVCDASGGRRSRSSASTISNAPTVALITSRGKMEGSDDALSEVNAERAKRGLKPFIPDAQLNQAARTCAATRATHQIHGHLNSDFDALPAGAKATSAGCGALEPSWGWGSCCTYDNYTYGGAAWVMGADGRRYMHLFCR